MRVKTVRVLSRCGLLLAGVGLLCHPPAAASHGSAGLLETAAVDYAALALLAQVAFPKVRRSDLTKAVIAFVASLEGLRALTIWHGDAIVLLEGLGAVLAAHAISFIEQFRSGARQAPESPFKLAYSIDRRSKRRRSTSPGQHIEIEAPASVAAF